jgi:electron transport complex protein RnfC
MPPLDAFVCSREEAIARLRDAGVVGMGGASFPTDVKLAPPADKPVDTIIANGAECEPCLTIDYRTMIESPVDVVEGLAIAAHIVGAARAVVAIESNKADALPVIEQQFAGHSHGIPMEAVLVATKYPEGGEKMLIKAVTGREVPSHGLPADIGVIVQNVGTLKAIKEAFADGKPLIERGFTVSGGACRTPKNLCAPIGTIIADLIPNVIQISDDLRKVLFGGPMMGVAVPSLQIPIAKGETVCGAPVYPLRPLRRCLSRSADAYAAERRAPLQRLRSCRCHRPCRLLRMRCVQLHLSGTHPSHPAVQAGQGPSPQPARQGGPPWKVRRRSLSCLGRHTS